MASSSSNPDKSNIFPVQYPSYVETTGPKAGQRRINFDNNNLEVIHAGNRFQPKVQPGSLIPEDQQTLLDNLWQSYLKKNNGWFINTLNALTSYFLKLRLTRKFQFYCVFRGDTPGVYRQWTEAMVVGVGRCNRAWYKGVQTLPEAISLLKTHCGDNFFISPDCNANTETGQAECSNCETMIKHFRIIKERNDQLISEKAHYQSILQQYQTKIQTLELDLTDWQTKHKVLLEKYKSVTQPTGSGVKYPASPVQPVTGKDKSNPVMARSLLKASEKPNRSGERSTSPDSPASGKDTSSPETQTHKQTKERRKLKKALKKKLLHEAIEKKTQDILRTWFQDNLPKGPEKTRQEGTSGSKGKEVADNQDNSD